MVEMNKIFHSVHWSINPPPLNLQTVQGPLLRQFPPIYWFFANLPPPINFLSLNIPDFSLLFMQKLQPPAPPEKSHPLFPSNPSLKIEILSSPPENLVGGSVVLSPP